jgi:cytochrome b subunit of formate dehydrogenase
MFRNITLFALFATVAIIALHYIITAKVKSSPKVKEKQKGFPIIVCFLRKLAYVFAILSVLVLIVTGFVPTVLMGKTIYGYWLMLHATFGGVFAVCIMGLAVMSSSSNAFSAQDFPAVCRLFKPTLQQDQNAQTRSGKGLAKLCYWFLLTISVVLTFSIVLSMFPLFGTGGQEFLISIHRYCGLAFAAVAIIHTYLFIRI